MTQAGMTADQAAAAGQAMLESAKTQKDQIAGGFLSQRQAVLDEVARRQAEAATAPTQASAAQAAAPQFTQEEIDAALRALGAIPQAQPQAQPQVPALSPAPGPAVGSQVLVMQEIALAIRQLVAAEVRAQLSAAGVVPGAAPTVQNRAENAAENSEKVEFHHHKPASEPSTL